MTSILISLCLAIYYFLPVEFAANTWGFFPSAPLTLGYCIRTFTYAFVHGSLGHVLFNNLLFFPAGLYLEQRLGGAKVAALFIVGAIGSALCFKALTFFPLAGVLIGNSGSVATMMGLALLLLAQEGRYLAAPLLALLVVNDLAGFAFFTMGMTSTAHAGHLGGFLVAICAFPFIKQD